MIGIIQHCKTKKGRFIMITFLTGLVLSLVAIWLLLMITWSMLGAWLGYQFFTGISSEDKK